MLDHSPSTHPYPEGMPTTKHTPAPDCHCLVICCSLHLKANNSNHPKASRIFIYCNHPRSSRKSLIGTSPHPIYSSHIGAQHCTPHCPPEQVPLWSG